MKRFLEYCFPSRDKYMDVVLMLRSPRFRINGVVCDAQSNLGKESGEEVSSFVSLRKLGLNIFGLMDASRGPLITRLPPVFVMQCRKFGSSISKKETLSRDLMVKLWAVDKRKEVYRKKIRRRKIAHQVEEESFLDSLSSFRLPSLDLFSNRTAIAESGSKVEKITKQPPISQHTEDLLLSGRSSEVAKLAPLLARADLLITREVEWANIMFAFEQENRYAIIDPMYPQSPVGFIREQSNVLYRQLLRSRRPFIARITDALGNELFRVRRPFWWINSTIYAEIDDKVIGIVQRRWHLWKRIYDLYLGNKQFAAVENPGFWDWTFTLKDEEGNVLAQIDRNWRGFGFELFTSAGQYVIRFGDADSSLKSGMAEMIKELDVARPLTMSERTVAVALAISLDNDYFSRRGGWGLPILVAEE